MAYEQDYWTQFQPAGEVPLMDPRQITPPGTPGSNTGFPGPSVFPPGGQGPAAPAPQPGAPPQTGSSAGRGDFGRQWLASGGRTVTDLQRFVEQWNAANPNARVTLGGSKGDKVYGPQGEYWADAVLSAGIGGGQGAVWNEDTGGGSGGSGGGIGGDGFGDWTKPYGERYTLPTQAELEHMPGYQAGLKAYTKGIETSAASRGTLLTGGTLQKLGQAGADYTAQSYGQLAGLSGGAFDRNYNVFRNNQNDPFNKFYDLARLGQS